MAKKKTGSTDAHAATAPAPASNGPPETKADKFRRLVGPRMAKLLKAYTHVRNLSVRANYEYTPEQARKITDTIERETQRLHESYHRSQVTTDTMWSLE